jgi:hypothetical protein
MAHGTAASSGEILGMTLRVGALTPGFRCLAAKMSEYRSPRNSHFVPIFRAGSQALSEARAKRGFRRRKQADIGVSAGGCGAPLNGFQKFRVGSIMSECSQRAQLLLVISESRQVILSCAPSRETKG